jgi:cation:H+ antiporter
MSSASGLLLLAGGLVLVVVGAELFFEGLLATATRLRVSAFVLAVLVSGFELENLAAGIAAALKGLPDAAAGTFLGGTTFLALAVPGLSAVAAPIRARLPGAVFAWSVAAPLPLLVVGLDGELSRSDGGLLVGWAVICLAGLVYSGRNVIGGEPPRPGRFPLVRLFAGLAVLTGGGWVLGEGLRRTVTKLGVSQALLGNVPVAAAVEAEEVARVAIPARRGRGDVAIANILGTIVHFSAFNAGVIALVRPLELSAETRHLYLPVSAVSVAVLVSAVATKGGLSRSEGVLLLAAYAAYVAAAIVVSA